ncbi:MAG: DUF1501 domain-containing protein [Bryobacterales bacterium]
MKFADFKRIQTRRDFFRFCGGGLETIALAHLLQREGRAAAPATVENPLAARPPHFAPKAKNVIFLFMEGAPSQIDLYDPKPGLKKWHGQPLPESMTKDLKLAFVKPSAKVLASSRVFKPHGQSGTEFSDYIPNIAGCADDICVVRSMHTEAFNHHPGQSLLMSGHTQLGRPTMGAWAVYGLGSESESLPAFVVLSSGRGTSGGSNNWTSGFLPSTYQGVVFRSSGDPILYLPNPPGISSESQRARLDAIRMLNEERRAATGDIEIAARIQSYELAYRMQASAPELLDFSRESKETLEMYGIGKEPMAPYATNCLLARRMVEKGVRYVMLAHASWDDHQELDKKLKKNCEITDQPIGALLKDLKQRGLLDSTLVVWAGEFGRTPLGQFERLDEDPGRDHHPDCFTIWLAGGGIQGGQVIGKTDELCLNVVEDSVHIHDLQATIMHCLGMDHTKLTYRHLGRDFRLTDVGGQVVQKMLA